MLIALALCAPAAAGPKIFGVSDANFRDNWPTWKPLLEPLAVAQIGTWSYWDCRVGIAEDLGAIPAGQPLLLTLTTSRKCAPRTEAARRAFAIAAAGLVRAYDVRELQVWNEPDRIWPGSAREYALLLAATYDAVKVARPDVLVLGLGAGPDAFIPPYPAWMRLTGPSLLRAVRHLYLGGRSAPVMDGLAYHPYWYWRPAFTRRIAHAVDRLLRGTPQPTPGTGLKLWWTETGFWSSGKQWGEPRMVGSPAKQARRIFKVARAARCSPLVAADFNFLLFDQSAGPWRWMSGFYEVDGTAKPALTAFRAGSTTRCGSRRARRVPHRPVRLAPGR